MSNKVQKQKKKLSVEQISKRNTQNLLKELQKKQKFYLVGITGRTSFILQNMNARKFKITIGNQLKCSCMLKQQYHCLHTLYVLTQIFYMPVNNSLLFQHKYTNKQLRYIIANRIIHTNRIADFLKCTKNRIPKIIVQENQQQLDQQPENMCAICRMQIVKRDAITTCDSECGNAFHLQCFLQWAKHEVNRNGVIKCPLCRDMKPVQYLKQLRQKEYEHIQTKNASKVGKQFYFYCDGCQLKEIKPQQSVFKCIVCEDVTLCLNCFNLGKHIRHSFICKNNSQDKWRDCEDRKLKKKLDQDQGLIRMKIPNYRRFFHFLASSLPCYFSKNTRWNVVECKKLQIKVQQLECISCHDKKKAFLRRMNCGHFIHHKCLRRRIEKGKFFCKVDGQKFLLGYDSLLKHEKLNKNFQNLAEQQESQQEQKYQKFQKSEKKNNRFKISPTKSLRSTTINSSQSKRTIKSVKQLHNRSLMAVSHSLNMNPQ